MPKIVATGLKKVNTPKYQTEALKSRREAWTSDSVSDVISQAYEDWRLVTGSSNGWANYVAEVLDERQLLHTNQKQADVEIVEEFFQNVPEDTVLGLLTGELVESIIEGEVVRPYGE